jgi:hypothetical protein
MVRLARPYWRHFLCFIADIIPEYIKYKKQSP